MTATLSTEIELAGILIEVEADFDVEYADNSFDHAFGTQHEYAWEVNDVVDSRFLTDIREAVTGRMHELGRTIHNRRWKKQHRQWRLAIACAIVKTDFNGVFDWDSIVGAAESQYGDKPDPPERDDNDYSSGRDLD